VRAQLVVELREPRLRGGHLQLAQAHIVDELGRADDQVDDRAHEREQRRGGRARDQHRVVDAAAGVGVRPEQQGQPHHDQHEQQHVDRGVHVVVLDVEDGDGEHDWQES
jgi:hypothetical protein